MNPLSKTLYSLQERTAIEYELISFALCKNENYDDPTKRAWIDEFENMNMTSFEAIKRIRLAKLEKKFGVTEFAVFMNVNLSDYGTFYKHEKKQEPETRVNYDEKIMGYGVAICYNKIKEFPNILLNKEYVIIDEYVRNNMHDKNILLRDESGYTAFYPAEYFKLKQ